MPCVRDKPTVQGVSAASPLAHLPLVCMIVQHHPFLLDDAGAVVDWRGASPPYVPPLLHIRESALVDGAALDWDLAGATRSSSGLSDSDG